MVNLRSIDQTVMKWQNRTTAAVTEYEAGIRQPLRDWAANAANAEQNYVTGVQQAITRKAFSKGVRDAGSEKWQRKALAVGPSHFTSGVSAAVQDYGSGFAKVHETLSRLSLPARGAKGDPKNLERVKAVVTALRTMKIGTTTT